MSRADSIFAAAAAPALMSLWSRSSEVQYTPAGGPPVTLRAAIGEIASVEVEERAGRGRERRRRVIVHLDPASPYGGIQNPAINATFTFDGETWAVKQITAQNATLCEMEVAAVGSMEVSVPGYRRQRM